MPKTHHPYLTATLGEAALRLPPELAPPMDSRGRGRQAHLATPWPPHVGIALRLAWCRCWSCITPLSACA
jgi:hypothetical protein